ncbi:MAG: zf-TFIIB domain-containing protein [Planctomycetes bacterium]|nr:zf-TFIIB domain-containing protein [Planctomycetota bacterium]
MLIACEKCHRHYDASAHRTGARLRCACGQVITVPAADGHGARELRMLHCSSCGAGLPTGATSCTFCGSGVGLGERGLGDVCPTCLSRMIAGAQFCSSCGTAVGPENPPHALTSWSCPRCSGELHECDAAHGRVVECRSCGGLWLDEHLFDTLVSRRDEKSGRAVPGTGTGAAARKPLTSEQQVRYLPCPVCGERMNRRNFANSSGVILDWCRGHGWWFDPDELDRVLAFVGRGGLQQARRRETRELESRAARARAAGRSASMLPIDAPASQRKRSGGWLDVLGAIGDFLGSF